MHLFPNIKDCVASQETVAADESVRLVGLEQSLMVLWERVEARGEQAEQRHKEVLRLYSDLLQQQQQLLSARGGIDESWLEQGLERLRIRLDQEERQRQQVRPWTHRDLVLFVNRCSRFRH